MITVKEISAEKTYPIRKEILRKNIPLTEKNDQDLDETTFHLGVFMDDKLVGVSTFMKDDSSYFSGFQYRLRGMATLEEYQGKGIGKAMLEKSYELLQEKGVDVLWCNARIIALNFYKKLGFEVVGPEFDIHLIGPHYVMFKKF